MPCTCTMYLIQEVLWRVSIPCSGPMHARYQPSVAKVEGRPSGAPEASIHQRMQRVFAIPPFL